METTPKPKPYTLRCKLCQGSGWLQRSPQVYRRAPKPERCHACNGRGYVQSYDGNDTTEGEKS